ncbi:MAG TPA: Calx-beta domain-containing protein, partial [Lutibacter sp.]|nr:Calx-beta domain-containing protein [Lutibacter sp.]
MKKTTLLLKATFLILFIFGFTNLSAQGTFDGDYCPLGGNNDEYATGVVFSKAIDNNASGTCEIHTIWAKIVDNTSEPSLRLAFKIGNNGSALYRIYLDTDNDPTAGLLYDSFGGPLTVLGAEYVLEIDSKDNGLARLLKWTGGNNLTDVTSDPLYDNFAGLNGDSDGCDGSDGKFIEFNIPFTILDLCDSDSPGVINIAQYATVSGGSPSSSRCLIGTLSFSIPLTGYVDAVPDTVCAGESTVLNLMGLTGNVTIIKWQYNEGGGWIDIVNSENKTTYTAENLLTTTRFRVVLQNTNICTDEYESDEVTVTVNPLPAAPTTSPVTYCAGDIAIPLTATGTNLKWYTIPTGGTGSSTAPTPSTVSAGVITYYVSQTNVYNCEGPRASLLVTVNPLPTAPTTSPMTYCAGDIAIPLTATGTNLKWYTTPTGGTGSSSAPTPSTVLAGTTTYYVSQTNATNCEGPRASIVVTVNALPIINQVTASNPTIATCPILNNGSITINATGANLRYSINNGGSYQTSNIFNGLTSGTYQIVVKNNTTNCLAYYTENVVLTNPVCISNVGIVTTTNAAEPSTNGLFTLTLTNPLVIDTEITYTVTGTASNGTDYATIGTKVTILANQTSVTIPVNVIDDNTIEATETVIITLISTNTLVTVDPTKNIATVLITDNDGGPQNGLVINDVTVNENAGNAIFTVTLTGNVQGGFTVNYATANGSAIAPSDYTSTNGTLSFTGNNNEVKTITVPIINDNLIEPTENFVVNLSNLSTMLIGINDGQGMGTITDNDGGPLNGIVINDVTVNESAGNATFTVTLTGNVQGGFTVD